MIAYFDASALVKRYVTEQRSAETIELSAQAEVVATSLVSRAEVAAAFAKATRSSILPSDEARKAQRNFAADWPDYARLPVTESLAARAEALAWDHALRGYDAVQLASALMWQESLGADVIMATFDARLWKAARLEGLNTWPTDLVDGGQGDGTAPERAKS